MGTWPKCNFLLEWKKNLFLGWRNASTIILPSWFCACTDHSPSSTLKYHKNPILWPYIEDIYIMLWPFFGDGEGSGQYICIPSWQRHIFLLSLASHTPLREKGVWWPCVQRVVLEEFNNYKNTSRTTANFAQYSYANYIYLRVRVGIVTKKQYTNFQNLNLIGRARISCAGTTRCTRSHQIPFLPEIEGCGLRDYFLL